MGLAFEIDRKPVLKFPARSIELGIAQYAFIKFLAKFALAFPGNCDIDLSTFDISGSRYSKQRRHHDAHCQQRQYRSRQPEQYGHLRVLVEKARGRLTPRLAHHLGCPAFSHCKEKDSKSDQQDRKRAEPKKNRA